MAGEARWKYEVLDSGKCEPLKMSVHGVLLATMAVCAAYNSAAWLKRREKHLAINAVLYTAGVWWERCHVLHHIAACARDERSCDADSAGPTQLSDAA